MPLLLLPALILHYDAFAMPLRRYAFAGFIAIADELTPLIFR